MPRRDWRIDALRRKLERREKAIAEFWSAIAFPLRGADKRVARSAEIAACDERVVSAKSSSFGVSSTGIPDAGLASLPYGIARSSSIRHPGVQVTARTEIGRVARSVSRSEDN